MLALALFLSSCSADWLVGDGRGDWILDLCEGYAIAKINSKEIVLVHKENPNDSGGSFVLSCYYVISYQLYEPYICLKGIPTQGTAAAEDELKSGARSYYLVDTSNDDVFGPFESYIDFAEYCNSLGFSPEEVWLLPTKPSK